jgi:hypothetical protein
MTIRGYDKQLYILPFDHRGSFETGIFGCAPRSGARGARGIGSFNAEILHNASYRLRGLCPLV